MKGSRLEKVVLLSILVVVLPFLPVLVSADEIQFTGDLTSMSFDLNPLTGVPDYTWYHGCSPTSGGMLMGYWAEHGYSKLLPGVTNPMNAGSQNPPSAVYQDISSAQHNARDTYVGHTANSIADFMKTVNGGTYLSNIASGLAGWSNYCGVGVKTAYDAEVAYFGGSFTYSNFVSQINAGDPMLLNLTAYAPGEGWVGHTIMAYGYQANMFNLRIYNGRQYVNVTVPGIAVMDTWNIGVGPGKQASWVGWNGQTVYAQKDSQGRVWWPFLDISLTDGYFYTNQWDWEIDDGDFYLPGGTASGLRTGSNLLLGTPIPIPGSLWLFGSGLAGFLTWRKIKAG
jgi:hypothetical protein